MAYVVGNVKERHKIIGSATTIQIKTNSKQNSAQIYHALCRANQSLLFSLMMRAQQRGK
jgi:hypothetical protein